MTLRGRIATIILNCSFLRKAAGKHAIDFGEHGVGNHSVHLVVSGASAPVAAGAFVVRGGAAFYATGVYGVAGGGCADGLCPLYDAKHTRTASGTEYLVRNRYGTNTITKNRIWNY